MRIKEFLGKEEKRIRKMKVLYVGCYRDGTGWGNAAIDYILSLDAAGIDVVPRAIKLNNKQVELPSRIIELENKSSKSCDVCIQHTLPHFMEYSNAFKKNIALYATETSNFIDSDWSRRINMMDEAWVINNQMAHVSVDSGVTVPIKVVPHATDFSKFERTYDKLDFPSARDSFVFYTVADWSKRKNIESFIRAFHTEFEPEEPVSLLIKTNKHGVEPEQLALSVRDMCNAVKTKIKKFDNINKYKEDLIVTDYTTELELYRLHNSCDCFVMPSYGEAWCIPAFDAMGFGKTPICTNIGGMSDFIKGAGFLIEGRMEPVYGMMDTLPNLFTPNEDWCSIDINGLREVMRHVYENAKDLKKMKLNGLKQVYEYSYENIGNLMKETINA